MATIQEIESNLLAYSLNGNFTLLARTVNGIAANQVALVSKAAASRSLIHIADHDAPAPFDDTVIANAVRNLVQKLGTQVDTVALGDAMKTFSGGGNFKALDAVTDYLTTAQKTEIGRSFAAGETLLNIAGRDDRYFPGDDAEIAATTRDLMSKLGTHMTDSLPIGEAMRTFSENGNFKALDAVTDYLTTAQKTEIGRSFAVGETLLNIAERDNPYFPGDDAEITATTRDLMSKLGTHMTDSLPIAKAMKTFSENGNFKALDAVTDYLTTAQKTEIGRSFAVGETLLNIVGRDDRYFPGDDAEIASVVRDLMGKLGTHMTDSLPIAKAMKTFSENGNFKALDAVTDYLTTAQKTEIGRSFAVGETLLNIVGRDDRYFPGDDAEIASVVRDLMGKLGAHMTDSLVIGEAMRVFSENGNFIALDAVTKYLTVAQKTEIGRFFVGGETLLNVARHDDPYFPGDDADITAVVRNLMSKMGVYITDTMPIGEAMRVFSKNGNFEALDAVTDYLLPAQRAEIGRSFAAVDTLLNIVGRDDPYFQGDNSDIAAVARDLMSKVGIHMNGHFIGEVMRMFSENGNFEALDTVTDFLTAAQKTEIGRSFAAGETLLNIVGRDDPYFSGDDAEIASVVRDLMSKIGTQITDLHPVGEALAQLSAHGNDVAVGSILDYLTSSQFSALPAGVKAGLGDVLGNYSANTLTGTAAHDTIFGLGGNDTIRGGAGHDKLFGNSGNDYLYGQDGNDVLAGGLGADVLSGGKGADTFVFDNRSGVDTITDFSRAEGDRIDLSGVLDAFDPLTDAITDFVSARNNGADTILSIDINGTAAGGVYDIVVIQNVTNLNVLDLLNTDTIIV